MPEENNLEVSTEVIIENKIASITKQLEDRITYLMSRFARLEQEIYLELSISEEDIDNIKSKDTRAKLNEMVGIFIELKPIERLIRFKYKEFNNLFDKLSQIENERIYGTFFSFLSCIAVRKKYTKKNIFIQRSLIGTSSLE